jgi:hypothetical protein
MNTNTLYVRVYITVYQYNETKVMPLLLNFFKNLGPIHVSSITCSSTASAAQTALSVLRACYVSWLLPGLEWNAVLFQS